MRRTPAGQRRVAAPRMLAVRQASASKRRAGERGGRFAASGGHAAPARTPPRQGQQGPAGASQGAPVTGSRAQSGTAAMCATAALCSPGRPAQHHPYPAGDEAQHLVRGGMVVVVDEDPVAPAAGPAMAGEQHLGRRRVAFPVSRRQYAAMEQRRQARIVRDGPVIGEAQQLGAARRRASSDGSARPRAIGSCPAPSFPGPFSGGPCRDAHGDIWAAPVRLTAIAVPTAVL